MRPELVGASRAKLLEILRASAEPLSSHDLAAAAGLHVTTARFHLEILGQSGLIETHVQRHGRTHPPTRGRREDAGNARAISTGQPAQP